MGESWLRLRVQTKCSEVCTHNLHFYNTRSSASNNFNTKPSRLSIRANSFSRIGVKVWNEIPQALRNLSKNEIKANFIQLFRFKRLLYRFISDYKKCINFSPGNISLTVFFQLT